MLRLNSFTLAKFFALTLFLISIFIDETSPTTINHPWKKKPSSKNKETKSPIKNSATKPPVKNTPTTSLPPIHGNLTMISRKYNRHTLLQYLAKKPKLYKTKFLSDAKKKFYHSLLGGLKPTKHDLNEASKARLHANQVHNRRQEEGFHTLPFEFDAREKWPDCESISEIQQQSGCGACWAVATASVMSNRACIASDTARQPRISAIDIASCCKECHATEGNGCEGGYHNKAFKFFENQGAVTGGKYGSGSGCKPYPFSQSSRPMDDHFQSPACVAVCDSTDEYFESKHYGAIGSLKYPEKMEDIMEEIYHDGPVATYIDVFDDLIHYTDGVYYHQNEDNTKIGGHFVRIIGWGENTDGTPYWLMANSWGEEWGESGFFKMIRGVNNVDSEVYASANQYDYSRSSSL